MRTAAATSFALLAFAANSVLCRLALGAGRIDAGSFTAIRIVSGAVALLALSALPGRSRAAASPRGSWASALALFLYAVAFSFAYLSLSTGTGALILFGAVQVTMILAALRAGERPHAAEWLGLLSAVGGVVYLVFPGLTAPSPVGCALMAAAGAAWGVYSLRGRRSGDALADTTWNFVRAAPLVVAVGLVFLARVHLSARGVLLAVASGAVASAVGYVVWYVALRGLTATRAATVQLAVPVVAAAGGIVFLGERVTLRLAVAAVMILGGVGAAVLSRSRALYRPAPRG